MITDAYLAHLQARAEQAQADADAAQACAEADGRRQAAEGHAADAGAHAERARQLADDARGNVEAARAVADALLALSKRPVATQGVCDQLGAMANDMLRETGRATAALDYVLKHAQGAADCAGRAEAAACRAKNDKPKAPGEGPAEPAEAAAP